MKVSEELARFESRDAVLRAATVAVVESLIVSGVIRDTLIASEPPEELVHSRLKGFIHAFDRDAEVA